MAGRIMNKILAKNPWLGAILNALLPGVVYLFVGRRNKFGALLVLGIIFAFFSSKNNPEITQPSGIISVFSVIFIQLAFAVDGYNECKDAKMEIINKEKK